MLDWQVTEEEELPPLPAEERTPRRVTWRWVALFSVLLAALAGGLLWQRLRTQEAVRSEDLLAFIRQEEQALRFGLEAEVADLAAPDSNEAWLRDYRGEFLQETERVPVSVTLGTVEWDEAQNALAVVELDDVPMLRYYERDGRSWRRAPVAQAFWGEPRRQPVEDALTLTYFERDLPFAGPLLAALPDLLDQLRAWGLETNNETVSIEPAEFEPALRSDDRSSITLNSPLLLGDGQAFSPESRVRLAFASALGERTTLAIPPQHDLPGAGRMLQALRAMLLLHWALDEASLQSVRTTWEQMAQADPSQLPLFAPAGSSNELDPLDPASPADAALLQLADQLYAKVGPDGVTTLALALPTATDWEALFADQIGLSFAELVGGANPAFTLGPPMSAIVDPRPAPVGHLYATVDGAPLLVRINESTLRGPDGGIMPTSCAPLFRDLQVERGEWVETGYRFQAQALTARSWEPAFPPEAPPPGGDRLFLLRESAENKERTFVAPGNEGEMQPLLHVPPEVEILPLRGDLRASTQAALLWGVPGCDNRWVIRYDLVTGELASWLLSVRWPSGKVRVFAEGKNVVVAVEDQGGSGAPRWMSAQLADGVEGRQFPSEQLPALTEPVGRTAQGEWLLYAPSSLGDTVEVYDAEQPNVRSWVSRVEGTRLSDFVFDGTRLYYLTPQTFDATRGATLHMIDAPERDHRSLMWLPPEVMVLVDPAGPDAGAFISNTGPAGTSDRDLVQVVRVDPANRLELIRSTLQSGAAHILSARACPDESVVYLVQDGPSLHLYRWLPTVAGGETMLWSVESPVSLWGCAG